MYSLAFTLFFGLPACHQGILQDKGLCQMCALHFCSLQDCEPNKLLFVMYHSVVVFCLKNVRLTKKSQNDKSYGLNEIVTNFNC